MSLSPDGSTVAIGATSNAGGGFYRGHVRVYGLTSGAWVQLGSDIDGDADYDYLGQSVSLSSDGSRVAIGASGDDGAGSGAGQVRVYDLTGGAWAQVGSDINGEAAGDYSGSAVSLSPNGTRVAIGARGNDGGGDLAGQVRVYDLTGSAWVQVGSDINGEAAGDYSGSAVSLSPNGSRVAIGASGNDGTASSAGHVRVYELPGGGGGGVTSEPRSLRVGSKTATSRKLRWKAPARLNGGTITDYVIQYRIGGTSEWSTFTDGISTSRKVKVTGLTKGVKYQFQVAARAAGGDSPYSVVTQAR